MDFGVGYHWRNPNLMIASRTDASDMPIASAAPTPVVAVKPVPVPTAKPAPIVTAQPAPIAPEMHEPATTPEMLADAPTDEAPMRKAPAITKVIEEPATAEPTTAHKRWASHHGHKASASKHWASRHQHLASSQKAHAKHKVVRTARVHRQQYAILLLLVWELALRASTRASPASIDWGQASACPQRISGHVVILRPATQLQPGEGVVPLLGDLVQVGAHIIDRARGSSSNRLSRPTRTRRTMPAPSSTRRCLLTAWRVRVVPAVSRAMDCA